MSSLLSMTFTRLSKVIAAVLVSGYVVQLFVPSTRQYLALVPGRYVASQLRRCQYLNSQHPDLSALQVHTLRLERVHGGPVGSEPCQGDISLFAARS